MERSYVCRSENPGCQSPLQPLPAAWYEKNTQSPSFLIYKIRLLKSLVLSHQDNDAMDGICCREGHSLSGSHYWPSWLTKCFSSSFLWHVTWISWDFPKVRTAFVHSPFITSIVLSLKELTRLMQEVQCYILYIGTSERFWTSKGGVE